MDTIHVDETRKLHRLNERRRRKWRDVRVVNVERSPSVMHPTRRHDDGAASGPDLPKNPGEKCIWVAQVLDNRLGESVVEALGRKWQVPDPECGNGDGK